MVKTLIQDQPDLPLLRKRSSTIRNSASRQGNQLPVKRRIFFWSVHPPEFRQRDPALLQRNEEPAPQAREEFIIIRDGCPVQEPGGSSGERRCRTGRRYRDTKRQKFLRVIHTPPLSFTPPTRFPFPRCAHGKQNHLLIQEENERIRRRV